MTFMQKEEESLSDAWEHFKDLERECSHHELEKWFIVQSLQTTPLHEAIIRVIRRRRFMNLNVTEARKISLTYAKIVTRLEAQHRANTKSTTSPTWMRRSMPCISRNCGKRCIMRILWRNSQPWWHVFNSCRRRNRTSQCGKRFL